MQRRLFLKTASWGALSHLAGVSPLRSVAALAQNGGSNDYKALVCLFLRGGNDSNNMVIPIGSAQYGFYSGARGSNAVQQNQVLKLPGSACGLHPAFINLQAAFASGQAAVIANVGPLVQPTTVAQCRANNIPLPTQLFAHDGQQELWESGGYASGVGSSWTGLTDDMLGPLYNSSNLPMTTLLGTATKFGLGNRAVPFSVNGGAQPAGFWCSEGLSCYSRAAAAQQLISLGSNVKLLQLDQQIYAEAYKYNSFYNGILGSARPFKTAFPRSNPLSASLYTVATMIQLRSQIGARRQIFLIDAGGFDTHENQASVQPGLFAAIDQAAGIFTQVMEEMGVYNQVTLFTASDFARTLVMNTVGGSDHAWGGHHFVIGGAVKGGAVYGSLPDLDPNGPDDIDQSGRFVPQIALSQYMATLASWFGVPGSQLEAILPGLSNFHRATLGFV